MVTADLESVFGSPAGATMVAIVLTLATIVVSVWLSRRNRTRKSMSYEIGVTELVSLHSAADDAKGRIKIYFDDEEIEHVHLVEAEIRNTGNVPVMEDDFDQPLMVDLGEGASPLTVEVTETFPPELPAKAAGYKTGAVLAPLLLNPDDSLKIKILARNLREKPKCSYRFVGISAMTDAATQRPSQTQQVLKRSLVRALLGPPHVCL